MNRKDMIALMATFMYSQASYMGTPDQAIESAATLYDKAQAWNLSVVKAPNKYEQPVIALLTAMNANDTSAIVQAVNQLKVLSSFSARAENRREHA